MLQLPWLEDTNFIFPDVNTALTEPDGLLAASQCLTAELVISAYQQGIFPWYSDGQPVLWWSPNPRCVLLPKNFHISRSFKRTLNNQAYEIRINTAFRNVMLACAKPRYTVARDDTDDDQTDTWITAEMLTVYCQLHDAGFAHSIECWHHDQLVGGMYGLVLGDVFFGESMFSQMKDASKVAMHHLCTVIKPSLVDAQVYSKHLSTLGAVEIERADFIRHLAKHGCDFSITRGKNLDRVLVDKR